MGKRAARLGKEEPGRKGACADQSAERERSPGCVHAPPFMKGSFGVTPHWMWRDEVRTGALERVLNDHEPTRRPTYAVFPERRLVSPKVRAFVDFLAEEFMLDPHVSD